MKAKIIISTFLIVFIVSVTAQDMDTNYIENNISRPATKESVIRYGFKFGFDMQPITINSKDMINQLQNGYQAGLFLQIGQSFYFQPEIYYASYQNPTSSLSTEKIPSLRTPIMLGVRFIDIGIVSAHLMGGPVFSASISDIKHGMTLSQITKDWQIGVGVDVLGFITADVRYGLIKDVKFADQPSYFNLESSMLNVTVGIKLK